MMLSGVGIFFAAKPGFAFGGGDKLFGIAERDTVLAGEVFGAFGDEHHVGTLFENGARGANRILDPAQAGDGTCAKRGGVHNDGVAFDVAIEREMRAVAGVEGGIIFENDDSGFNGVEGVAAVLENGPAGVESAEAACSAGVNGIVGNVPGAAMNNQRRLHGFRG
jgi:hypothetical protein